MAAVLAREWLLPRGRGQPDGTVRDHAPAAQRHRLAAHRPRAGLHAAGHPDPLEAHAGVQRDVDAGHRPRVDRGPRAAREGPAAPRGQDPVRDRARRVHAPGLGMEGAQRGPHRRAGEAARVLARLAARAVHDGRALQPRGDRGVRPALRGRADLPRQADDQLGSGQRDRGVRPRGRYRGGERLAVGDPVSYCRPPRRGDHGRDHAARDHARRHRGRGPRARRALPPPARRGGRAAADRPADPDRRGRHDDRWQAVARSGVRLGAPSRSPRRTIRATTRWRSTPACRSCR